MSILADTGPDNRDLTITGFPALEQVGFVQEDKAARFYNTAAGSAIDRAGGSYYIPGAETYVPAGGMAIELVIRNLFAGDFVSQNYSKSLLDGQILFSLNGYGKEPSDLATDKASGLTLVRNYTDDPTPAAGYALVGSIAPYRRADTWVPSMGTVNDDSAATTQFSTRVESGHQFATTHFHHLLLNIGYDRTVDSNIAHCDLYLNGNPLVSDKPVLVPYVDFGAGDNRIPIFSLNIGGFEYIATALPAVQVTRSYDGLVDLVNIYNYPVSPTQALARAAFFGLPATP